MDSIITPARLIYHVLCFNIGILVVMFFKRELVQVIMSHKQRAQILLALNTLVIILYIQCKSLYNFMFLAKFVIYTELRDEVPQEGIEFVRWQSRNHKLERDFYLGLATILSSGLVYTVAHYSDKFDRFMDFK